jgi:hypothetical protein
MSACETSRLNLLCLHQTSDQTRRHITRVCKFDVPDVPDVHMQQWNHFRDGGRRFENLAEDGCVWIISKKIFLISTFLSWR